MSEAGDGHSHDWWTGSVLPTGLRIGADRMAAGRGITIAFLDSGFAAHPDVADRIVAFHDASGAGKELSGPPAESDWHGTQTCVVAAGDGSLSNGLYRGIASEARLVLVRVGRNGRIRDEDIASGLRWVLENRERYGVRIVSISLGGDAGLPPDESPVNALAEDAVSQGLTVVVAAGNSGCAVEHGSLPPATAPSAITVGGYQDDSEEGRGKLELYCSSYGLTSEEIVKPEIIALARGVAAPILPGTAQYERAEELARRASDPDTSIRADAQEAIRMEKIVATHYQHVDGTSFAAPIVSSVVAQMLEVNPDLSPAAVKRLLIETAERIGDASLGRQGYGILRPAAAVDAARREKHGAEALAWGPPRVENGRLFFTYHDDSARRVSVTGEFNGWNPSQGQFTRGSDGTWRLEIAAPAPGRYRYKLLVDDTRYIEDPSHGVKEPGPFGGYDSVLVVG